MLIRAAIFIFCLIGGCWASTLLLLSKLGAGAIPAQEWASLGSVKIFPPWLWIKWFYLYGDRFNGVFLQTMWPIYVSVMVGIAIAWVSRFFMEKSKTSTAHGSSRWAKESELVKAGLVSQKGVVLGQSIDSGKLLCNDGPGHVLAIAPTRGGKGVGLVIPTLLNWQESAVIFDPKGENWQITSGYRSGLGKCFCFDPTSPYTTRFNPLMEIRKGVLEVKDVQNIADIIIDPDGRIETRNHWQNAAHSLLVGTILHVLYDYPRKSLAGVVEFLTTPGLDFATVLEKMAKSHHLVVTSVAQEMLNKHIEERSGVLSTAISLLSIFRDPLVASATDEHDFYIASLRDAEVQTSLYLVLPPSDISRLRVLVRILLNQMGRVLTEQIAHTSQQRRILFLLDEFPSLGRLEFFESALAYMAGYGLKAFLICQSLNQLQKAYGERNAILDNCHVRVAFANNDDQTAKRLSDLLGEQTLTKEQTSISGQRFAMVKPSSSIAKIEFARPLLFPSEINRLPADEEIIFLNGIFPILANKIRYYQDSRFSSKVLPPLVLEKKASQVLNETPTKELEMAVPIIEGPTTIGSAL
jgi:type IV secretion system protein VirD4